MTRTRSAFTEGSVPQSQTVPAVSCSDLSYTFGPVRAVDGISFAVEPGEVFGLLGPNGAGKTTTIRILTTLLRPGGGSARIFGLDVAHRSMQARRLLGYVPQQLSIDAQLTGYENVWLFTRLFDVPRSERKGRAREVLTLMGLADVSDRMASATSTSSVRLIFHLASRRPSSTGHGC